MSTQAKDNPILIIGDWAPCVDSVKALLKSEGYRFETAAPGTSVIETFRDKSYHLTLICLPAGQIQAGVGLAADIRQYNDALPVIVISDATDYRVAVDIMKAGAADYLHFPVDGELFVKLIERQLKLYLITRRVFSLEESDRVISPFEGMVGRSEKMQDNFRMIMAVAKSNATVLVTGPSGTGKELVAKAVHRLSARSASRFVDLNCGAIPRDLLENELFGHEKGAFTGAHKRYLGSFEVAHKGTLFLDEISEMDPLLQVKLLRVLQERSFMRIGGAEKIDVDVRIIAATNRNLQETIEKGQFREDLFYRLNVVNITIPALKERREDIPLLAHHFLEYYSAKNNRIFIDFANDAMEAMINYDWPGNVRELENTIERIVVLHNDSQVKIKFLPKHIQKVSRAISVNEVAQGGVPEDMKITPLDDLERKAIEMALLKYQGNVSVAAKKLKIGQATLYRKVKKYGLAH